MLINKLVDSRAVLGTKESSQPAVVEEGGGGGGLTFTFSLQL